MLSKIFEMCESLSDDDSHLAHLGDVTVFLPSRRFYWSKMSSSWNQSEKGKFDQQTWPLGSEQNVSTAKPVDKRANFGADDLETINKNSEEITRSKSTIFCLFPNGNFLALWET